MKSTDKNEENTKTNYGESLIKAAIRLSQKWANTIEHDDFSKGYCQGLSESIDILREEYENERSK